MTRGSITGPLILISIGVLFLLHAISPDFRIIDLLVRYWPYLLILWGVIQLLEVCARFAFHRPVPINGISAAGWLLVVVICLAGLTMFEVRRPDTWWRRVGFEGSVEAFGQGHDYGFNTLQKAAGKTPRVVLESFRGDAKIVGVDGTDVIVSGHKTIQAFDSHDADRANMQTPVEVTVQGNTVTIRCNQDKAGERTPVTTDLDISVPRGSTIDATGTLGDIDVSSIAGDVDVNSDNAAVRLQDIDGNVKVDTRRSDLVRCTGVKGTVDLGGHGTDVELAKIAGQVTISGDYTGSVSLRDLAQPVRVQNMRTELNVVRILGEIRLDRGSLSVQNVVGPLRLTTRATDVSLDGFTNGLDLTVDKGDIDLRPGQLPLGKMVVHTKSGNIELALPHAANFALNANTDHGEIDNEFGEVLKGSTEGRGARLEGSVGDGPDLNLTTDRGSITVRKAAGDDTPAKVSQTGTAARSNMPRLAALLFREPSSARP
jgi:DUF4097 and DUF4098 domain-containing protein YvlB